MDRGIWAIAYDIAAEHQAGYLEWFHGVHVPEKLARRGYRWAAHYELAASVSNAQNVTGYLALFGGDTAYTFLNPSPRQLLTRQSAETRRYMGMRRAPSAGIFTEEVRIEGPAHSNDLTTAAVVRLEVFNASSVIVEDELGAWVAQECLPFAAKFAGCARMRTLLATVGDYKHAVLSEFTSLAACHHHINQSEAAARETATPAATLAAALVHAPRSPAVGVRIWPPAAG